MVKDMFDVLNFDAWEIFDGASEGSGRSEKIWLISNQGEIGLFKYPKIDPQDNKETTEYISEHLAHQLGNIINVPTAKVDIGIRGGRIGSMSYLVREEGEELVEGIHFISGKYPNYNAETLQDEKSGKYYCLEHIFKAVPSIIPSRVWIQMMLFDFLIGNTDRHQSNCALLLAFKTDPVLNIQVRQCPLYDNGSSLCCYANEKQVEEYLGKDANRFKALTDSKSRSLIRIDGTNKALPKHREVIEYLVKKYPITRTIALQFLKCLDRTEIDDIMDQYPEQILSKRKNDLIRRYLCKKLDILRNILNPKGDNDAT